MTGRTLWGGMVVGFLWLTPLDAQFAPEVATTFENLDPGEATGFEQDYTFFAGQQGPSVITVELDQGGFDLLSVAVDDVIGTVVMHIDADNPPPYPDVKGDIDGEIRVTAVSDDELSADVVVTSIDSVIMILLAILGLPDPTDDVAFTLTLTDPGSDLGGTLEAVEAGALPAVGGELDFDIPFHIELDPIYVHSAEEKELVVTTTVLSAADEEAEIVESYFLTGFAPLLRRGDVDGNGSTSALLDALFLLTWGFSDGDTPPCLAAADCDGNGVTSALLDGLYLLMWTFSDGEPPPDPGPTVCGPDPNDLECVDASSCD